MTSKKIKWKNFDSRNKYEINMLTKRENQVFKQVMKGNSNKEIADELSISIHTVKTHVARILQKKNARNRIQLITKSK